MSWYLLSLKNLLRYLSRAEGVVFPGYLDCWTELWQLTMVLLSPPRMRSKASRGGAAEGEAQLG